METAIYTIGANGMTRLCKRPELPKGTIIRAFGADMEESIWATTGKGDEIVKLSPNDAESYFSNPFNSLDEYCRPISEKFGIGFYYDLDAPRATDEEIAQAVERANNFIKEREEERMRAKEESERAREEVIKKYGAIFDRPSGKYHTDAVLVAKHIRQDLANAFPGQKFSVRKTDYSSIDIEWKDGPTREEVEQIAGKHERNCTRDKWNDDLWDHEDSAFTAVFGGVDYLYYYRETAPENREISMYTKPEPKQSEPAKATEPEGIQIVNYSEKAIAVIGDTRTIKDTLKAIGGRFNAHLTCGAGWIFSKSKEEAIKAALNI